MSRTLVAILVAILFAAAAGGWWMHANHKTPALAMLEPSPSSPASTDQSSRGAAAPGLAPPAPAEPQAADQPSFDVVRVEPKGDTVVAGKGAPNTKVALLAGGRKVGEAVSDASGQFVILPSPLPPGDYALTLRQGADGRQTDSKQSVAVSVPKPGRGSVVVALAEPGKATKLLSGPLAAPGAPRDVPLSKTTGKVAIASAELENGNGFYVTGKARGGAQVHVYLNDAHIADVVASPDGGWSVRVKKGLTGGHYVVRADGGGSDGRVLSRAEVPFDVPVAMAAATPPAPAVVASAAPAADGATAPGIAGAATTSGAAAVVDSIATARVTVGDNLWNISRFRLGDGKRYTQIYAANVGQIRNPDLIFPGQVFVVPQR